ncbi:MAG: rod shape-determining protein MreC [Patescibacteria group bacterium]
MKKGILIGLVIALIFIVFLTGFFIKKDFLKEPVFLIKALFSRADLYEENLFLKQQNEDLRAQINELRTTNYKLQTDNYLTAKIFSTYPFNIKNQLTINAGEKQGVKKGTTATIGENILVGQIIEVFENYSVARTIFDPKWQRPVRIGEEEVNGLLQGGNEPKITLIEKPVKAGDIIYSAVADFPYGLKIGEISEIKETASGIFKEAEVKVSYNINELREVNMSNE